MPARFALLIVISTVSHVSAADWPGWRGPTGDGRSTDTGFPVRWSGTENVKWKVPVRGGGHSSPAVSNGKVFVTGCDEDTKERLLHCFDRDTGKLDWSRAVVTAEMEPKHALNSYASSTPAADGRFVYVTFFDKPRARVYCYDFAGSKVWEMSPGRFHSRHGFCSPPVLYKNLVIVNGDQDGEAYIVALDAATGKEVWRADRPNRTRSYCPPTVFEAAGRKQLVLTGSKCVAGYEPDTGKQLWLIDGPTEQFVSSMVFDAGLFFLTAGYPEHWVMAIRPDGTGNVTKSHVAWSKSKEGGYVPSPVAHAGHFFLVTDNGLASCWEAKSGRKLWNERLGMHHSGSGVLFEGKVLFIDDAGDGFVLKATPEFELVSKNPLGERVYSSPALADGRIYIRGEKHLFRIGK